MTSDPSYRKDAEVKAFIDENAPPFVVEDTHVGMLEREFRLRRPGTPRRKNIGELAMMDFLGDEGGVRGYVAAGDPVLVLFEDQDIAVLRQPPNMHLLSTVGLLRGMERVGLLPSADAVIHDMTHPSATGRRPEDARALTDLPSGTERPARLGSRWEPG